MTRLLSKPSHRYIPHTTEFIAWNRTAVRYYLKDTTKLLDFSNSDVLDLLVRLPKIYIIENIWRMRVIGISIRKHDCKFIYSCDERVKFAVVLRYEKFEAPQYNANTGGSVFTWWNVLGSHDDLSESCHMYGGWQVVIIDL